MFGQIARIVSRSPERCEIEAGEHDEERGRVDRAVIAAERHLAEPRHLAAARFVEDLAGLGVGGLVDSRRPESAASVFSTPLAISGAAHSNSIAVMMPSRPKMVLYQGTPA